MPHLLSLNMMKIHLFFLLIFTQSIENEHLIDRGQKFTVQSVTLGGDSAWVKEYYLVELRPYLEGE
jgi:hypothetical protein